MPLAFFIFNPKRCHFVTRCLFSRSFSQDLRDALAGREKYLYLYITSFGRVFLTFCGPVSDSFFEIAIFSLCLRASFVAIFALSLKMREIARTNRVVLLLFWCIIRGNV